VQRAKRGRDATKEELDRIGTEQHKGWTAPRETWQVSWFAFGVIPQELLMIRETKKNFKLTRARNANLSLRARVNFSAVLSSEQEKYVFKERELMS
jgi:hypothetical protein